MFFTSVFHFCLVICICIFVCFMCFLVFVCMRFVFQKCWYLCIQKETTTSISIFTNEGSQSPYSANFLEVPKMIRNILEYVWKPKLAILE